MKHGAEGRASPGPWLVAALATGAALALLLPGLGEHGLWSAAELPVFQRVRAELGAPVSELIRSPWLPDQLRTWSVAHLAGSLGDEAAVRLPHALASCGLVGLAAAVARWRGATWPAAALVAGFALCFPVLSTGARTILGNPVGELLASGAIVAGLAASGATHIRARVGLGVLGLILSAGAVASLGLLMGFAIPAAVIALALEGGSLSWPRRALTTAAAIGVLVTAWLSFGQGDGYIPVLGAAKDLEILDDPTSRAFADTLKDMGYQVFPWAPLMLIGAIGGRRDTWPAAWLALGLTAAVLWNVIYGAAALPLTVPAALCAAAGFQVLTDSRPAARRFALLCVVLLMLAFAKDAVRTPSEVMTPLWEFESELRFPAEALDAAGRLRRLGQLALLGLLGAFLLTPHRDESRAMARSLGQIPPQTRLVFSHVILLTALVDQAAVWAHGLADQSSDQMSPKTVLQTHASLVAAGSLPAVLGAHRLRDPAVEIYGPASDSIVHLKGRRELAAHLAVDEPAAALIRASDLAGLHQQHREHGWPLYVLDHSHHELRLVANVLPPGRFDLNPILAVLPETAPPLSHETLLRFEDYVEIIGWDIEEPVIRGSTRTLELTFRVLRPLPAGTKLWARLLAGKTSRIAAEPHKLTGGIYPSNFWRAGDIVHHQHTFEAPVLEILPGAHQLIVGLRRSEKKNFEITLPEGSDGEFGVHVQNRKRTFAVVGHVEVL